MLTVTKWYNDNKCYCGMKGIVAADITTTLVQKLLQHIAMKRTSTVMWGLRESTKYRWNYGSHSRRDCDAELLQYEGRVYWLLHSRQLVSWFDRTPPSASIHAVFSKYRGRPTAVREFWMSWASSIKWGAASSDCYRFLLRPFQVTRHNRYKLYY